jgi:hypothetical protein
VSAPARCTFHHKHFKRRWDAAQPADVGNLVLLTFEEAEEHEHADLAALERDQPEFATFIRAKLDRARREFNE